MNGGGRGGEGRLKQGPIRLINGQPGMLTESMSFYVNLSSHSAE